jgi:hypothetical protein
LEVSFVSPNSTVGEKLLPYIEEALKIEKGRRLSNFFWGMVEVAANKEVAVSVVVSGPLGPVSSTSA